MQPAKGHSGSLPASSRPVPLSWTTHGCLVHLSFGQFLPQRRQPRLSVSLSAPAAAKSVFPQPSTVAGETQQTRSKVGFPEPACTCCRGGVQSSTGLQALPSERVFEFIFLLQSHCPIQESKVSIQRLNLKKKIVFGCFACMYVWASRTCLVPMEARSRHQISYNEL